MIRVALDTSLMVGLLDPKDRWHVKSLDLKNSLIEYDTQIVIFDCVIAEAISVLARRFHEKRRQGDFDNVGWLKRLADPEHLEKVAENW